MNTDFNLQHAVLEELDWEPSIDAAQVGVTSKDGVVTLTGHVAVYAQKLAAEEAAKRVHGVEAVANDICVRPSWSASLGKKLLSGRNGLAILNPASKPHSNATPL